MSGPCQPAILSPVPSAARFVTFGLRERKNLTQVLVRLAAWHRDPNVIVGLGEPLVVGAGRRIDGLRGFPTGIRIFPSSQEALWLALAHADRGAAFDAARAFAGMLGEDVCAVEEIDGFMYR